jgi:aryl-alcohol dehydrogenase-like predicted oxidoreductase
MDALAEYGPLETLQPPFHMFHRDIEDEVLPYTDEHDIGVLVYGPLAHGLLAGAMTAHTTFPHDDWRSHSADFQGERFARNLSVVEQLKAFAEEKNTSLPRLAIAWTITHPSVDVAIVGARRPAQLEELTPAADLDLSASDRGQLEEILANAVRVEGPSPEGM